MVDRLAAFVETARRGSVSRAAEALFVTQPALSARLQRLERELGAPLLARTGRGIRLTEAGAAFLPYAERVLDTLAEARRHVENLEAGRAGRLALGAAPAVSTYVLPAVLKRFAAAHPDVQVSVKTGHSEEVLELVLREQAHIGLVRALRHPEITSTRLYEDELVLVVEPEHRFAAAGEIEMEEIGLEQLVLFDRTSSYHQLTSAFFRRAGVLPRGVMELDNIESAKKMVQEGFGLALLPRTAVAADLAAGSLREVAIADADPVRREIVAIRRKDAGAPRATAAAFLRVLAETTAKLSR